jgi:tRNA pseudouridine55 synthase
MMPARSHDEGGVLLIRKPSGWTSYDVVRKVRKILKVRKAGHAGTLDPLATGLLIVCTGRKTRDLQKFQDAEKEYRVTMVLGARTASHDTETPVIERRPLGGITPDIVRTCIMGFTGWQTQTPPMYSAVKNMGTPLYKLARRGITVERQPREVYIRSIDIESVRVPEVSIVVTCSKGTYVRTLVDDIGTQLGCGAHVVSLERTRIGEVTLDQAVTLEQLADRYAGEVMLSP